MSRSGYIEGSDCEHINLYRATVWRTIHGKRGQAFLKELAAAMDAMPEKRLIREELVTHAGECCTIGVVCKSRALDTSKVDIDEADMVGKLVGISTALAAKIEFLNDEDGPANETPEQRWVRMRNWVAEQIMVIA